MALVSKKTVKHLNLFIELTLMQYKVRDQSTFLGLIWSFLNPLIMLIVLYIFFKARTGQEIQFYSIYLLLGVTQYAHFSNTTSAAMSVLRSMQHLTVNTIFPKVILVFSSVTSTSISFIFSLVISLGIALYIGIPFSTSFFLLPLIVVLQIMLVIWVSLILSSLYVFIKDLEHIYQIFLRILFFITPIFYTKDFISDSIALRVIAINPLTHLINFTQMTIIEGKFIPTNLLVLIFFSNVLLIFLSLKLFKTLEPRFAAHV